MAHLASLTHPESGLSEFVNVDAKVGRGKPNHPADVEAVQRLIAIIVSASSIGELGVPSPTGRFDAVTGFYIYDIQANARHHARHTVVDGVVTPAPRGQITYGGVGVYCILHMNAIAKETNPTAFASLLSRYQRPTT